jgi:hypothetical protein
LNIELIHAEKLHPFDFSNAQEAELLSSTNTIFIWMLTTVDRMESKQHWHGQHGSIGGIESYLWVSWKSWRRRALFK